VIGVRSSCPRRDERALGVDRRLDAVEHRVERARGPGELVVARHGDAPREVGLRDGAGRLGEAVERREDAPGHEEGQERGEGEHRDRDARRDLHGLVDLLLLLAEILRDREDPALLPVEDHGHREVADGPRGGLHVAADGPGGARKPADALHEPPEASGEAELRYGRPSTKVKRSSPVARTLRSR
jgi:hypothetical protein